MAAYKKNNSKKRNKRGKDRQFTLPINNERNDTVLTKTASPPLCLSFSTEESKRITRSQKQQISSTQINKVSVPRQATSAGYRGGDSNAEEVSRVKASTTGLVSHSQPQNCTEKSMPSPGITVTFTFSSGSHGRQLATNTDGDQRFSSAVEPQLEEEFPGAQGSSRHANTSLDTSPGIGDFSPSNSDIFEMLKSMNQSLKGELSSVTSRIGKMTSQMNKVANDLQSYKSRWEARMDAMNEKISKMDKNNQSLEKKWELHRADQSKELSIIQTGIDSNSSAVLELKNTAKSNQEKWENLVNLEGKIRKAADKKFQALKELVTMEVKSDLKAEIKEEVRSYMTPSTAEVKEGIATIKDDLLREVRSAQDNCTVKTELKAEIRAEIMEEVRSYMAPNSEEIQEGLASIKEDLIKEVRSTQATVMADINYERLKDKASAKKHNLIVLGLAEERWPREDKLSVQYFFKNRMGLHNLMIAETYRLGQQQADQRTPRPLVVRFLNIEDRWAVWNRKGSIQKDFHHPIWIQEDLPKKFREDNRVLNRIAKVARESPSTFQNIRIKDFKLSINGTEYAPDDTHLLPEQLKPERVYTPRSSNSCVFYTRHSPLSNHHPSPFQLDNQWFACVEQFPGLT